MKTIKIFLASSEELAQDRKEFGNLIRRLDDIYQKRGIHIQLLAWEDLDMAYNDRRKQEEYNDVIRQCHVFIALFYKQAGKYTREEIEVARVERQIRKVPHIIIYCRDLKNGDVESKELSEFKRHLDTELGHFWGHYGSGDKLHLDFVMWLQRTELEDKDALKVEDGKVTFEGIPIASMSQLPYVACNKSYQRMKEKMETLQTEIEKMRQAIEQCPGVDALKELLQQKLDEYNQLKKDFNQQQQALFDTAKRISEMQIEKISLTLRRAIEAFDEGNVERANTLLDEIADEAEHHLNHLEQQQHLVHQDIKAFILQAKTVMADTSLPITERINKTTAIYAKSEEWAEKSLLPENLYNSLLSDYGCFLLDYAYFEKAKSILLRLISNQEKIEGKDSLLTAWSYNNIGIAFYSLGEYSQALDYYTKALEIRKKKLGINHPDTANSYNRIGMVYNSLGNIEKTIEYYFKAMEIRENVLGKEHPDTAGSYNNVGNMCYQQGQYSDALDYYYKALKIRENRLGEGHFDTASSYSNIGMVYSDMGEYEKAIDYYSKALEIRKRELGPRHPDTAKSYNNIGLTCARQGDCAKALWAYFKAASIFDTVLGIEHPNTAITYNNIGLVFAKLENYEKAKEYYEKALCIFESSLGTNHSHTQTVRKNIELIRDKMKVSGGNCLEETGSIS